MLIQNAIKITENHPEEIFLVSSHRHDFQQYRFKDGTTMFVDGGTDYVRRGGDDVEKPLEGYATKWVDWCLDDKVPFDTIKARLLWGTRGKDGKQPLKYVRLAACETEHLEAILDYMPEGVGISPLYRNVIISILGDRKLKHV